MKREELRVGMELYFTDATPNPKFRGTHGTVKEIYPDKVDVSFDDHPVLRRPGTGVATFLMGELPYVTIHEILIEEDPF